MKCAKYVLLCLSVRVSSGRICAEDFSFHIFCFLFRGPGGDSWGSFYYIYFFNLLALLSVPSLVCLGYIYCLLLILCFLNFFVNVYGLGSNKRFEVQFNGLVFLLPHS